MVYFNAIHINTSRATTVSLAHLVNRNVMELLYVRHVYYALNVLIGSYFVSTCFIVMVNHIEFSVDDLYIVFWIGRTSRMYSAFIFNVGYVILVFVRRISRCLSFLKLVSTF